MRKKVMGRKFARNTNSRKALFRGLIRSLLLEGNIETTWAKAKAIQPQVDKLITVAKKNTLAAKRTAMARLGNDKQTFDKLFAEVLPSVESRKSGFTKLTHLPARAGDKAKMVKLELSDKPIAKKVEKAEKVKETKPVKSAKTKKAVKKGK